MDPPKSGRGVLLDSQVRPMNDSQNFNEANMAERLVDCMELKEKCAQ